MMDDPLLDPVIVSERVLDAPRATVFGAFTDPATLALWWGPAGFTNVFEEFDLRPGGTWRLVMHGPDGAEYRLEKRFLEIVPPERIVLQQISADHGFRMEMDFGDDGDRTRLTWRMTFERAEEAEAARPFILRANEENFDRLEAELAAGAVRARLR